MIAHTIGTSLDQGEELDALAKLPQKRFIRAGARQTYGKFQYRSRLRSRRQSVAMRHTDAVARWRRRIN
jgi:hypothetical protein